MSGVGWTVCFGLESLAIPDVEVIEEASLVDHRAVRVTAEVWFGGDAGNSGLMTSRLVESLTAEFLV